MIKLLKNGIEKYRKIPMPVKASFWFMICSFLQKGILMITTPIFTRILSEADYGMISVYLSWHNILSIIAGLNLAAGVYTKGLVKNDQDRDQFSSSLMGLSIFTTLIVFLVYFIFRGFWNKIFELPTTVMVAMFVDILFVTSYQFWSNRQRVEYKYKKLVLLALLHTFFSQAIGIMIVLMNDSNKAELKILSGVIVNVILYSVLLFLIINKGKTLFHKLYWKYALKFNLPLIPHYLSQIVLNQADRLMIASMCGNDKAGIYSVAYSLAMVLQLFSNAISGTLNPWIYQSIKDKNYKAIGNVSYMILSGVALINLILIAFAPELMMIMAPPSYWEAVWVIPPITASVYFMFLYNLFATFEYYFEKTGFVMAASLSGAVLNIVLNAIFIPKFGFVAAGYTTLVCYILYAFAHYAFMRMIIGKNIPNEKIYDVRIIVIIGVLLILASFVMLLFYNIPIARYLIVAVLVIISICKKNKIIEIYKLIKNK